MSLIRSTVIAAVLIQTVFLCTSVSAAVVTWKFTGKINKTIVTGPTFSGLWADGDDFTLTSTFDTTGPFDDSIPNERRWSNQTESTVTVNGEFFSVGGTGQINEYDQRIIRDSGDAEYLGHQSFQNPPGALKSSLPNLSFISITWLLNDIPPPSIRSGFNWPQTINPDDFFFHQFSIFVFHENGDKIESQFNASIDRFTSFQALSGAPPVGGVPEAPSLMVLALGLLGFAFARHRA